MGFWSTLGSIRANRANFKQWEKDEANNDAKRKELYQRSPLSEQELKEKQKLADTIIDTITIMDEQSESVSEDVEAITQPIVGLSMSGGTVLSSIVAYKYLNAKDKENSEEIAKVGKKLTFDQYKQIIELNEKNKAFKDPIMMYYDVQRVLKDSKEYKKLIIPEDLKSIVQDMHENYLKLNKKMFRSAGYAVAGVILSGIAAFLAATIGATKFQVGSSRVARYNARESLNDPKNFVIYTDEQIEQAKENLKNKPKEKKGFFSKFKKDDDTAGFFGNMKNLAMNKRKYDAWKKENDKRDPRIMRELTPEELEEAKRDKEVIQRVTKKINNRAEEYSENMETAATTILGSSILLGGIMSAAVNWILNKSGTNNKIASWVVGKLTNKETQAAYNKLLELDPKTKEYKTAQKDFTEKCSKHFYDRKASRSRFTEIKENLKEFYAKILTSRKGRNIGLFGFIGTGVTSFIGLIMALKLQKNAARAGRYNAKEELRNNPQEFISYSEKEMKQVENVKAEQKTIGQKFKEYMTFLPTAWKHYKEYDNYKKGELKDTKALKEELKKLEVSEEQLREGKNLQRKLFNTFEKIDDKSQEYSENMEAASDISMQFAQLGGLAAIWVPFVTLGSLLVAKRYDLLAKMGVNVADFLTRFTGFAKSKFVKNNIAEMTNRFEEAIEKQAIDTNQKTCAEAFENIEQKMKMMITPDAEDIAPFVKEGLSFVKNNKIIKWVSNLPFIGKLFPFLVKSAQGVSRTSLEKLVSSLEKSDSNKFKPLMDKLAKVEIENINTFFAKLKESTAEQLTDKAYLTEIINESKLPLDEADIGFISKLLGHIKDFDDKLDMLKAFLTNAEKNKNIQELPKDSGKISEIVSSVVKGGALLGGKIQDIKLTELIDAYIIKNIPEDASSLEKYLEFAKKIGSSTTSVTKNKKYYIRGARALARLSQNIPAEEISSAAQKILKIAIENPEKAANLLSNPREMKNILMTPSLNRALKVAGISWGVFCIGITFAVQSYFAKLQKEAGRLGVMKAMEELQDDRIYADEQPKQTHNNQSSLLVEQFMKKNESSEKINNLPPNIQKLINSSKDNKVAV